MNNTLLKMYIFFIIFIMFVGMFSSIVSEFDSEESTGINDYARITDVDYTAVLVDEPGAEAKVVVTERLTYDIHAASRDNLFWELWRDLPESTTDGLKTDYKVNYVKQIFDDGTTKNYKESSKLYWEDWDYTGQYASTGPYKWFYSPGPYSEYRRQYECVFFYIPGTYREELVFELQYEMTNAAFRYADCSDLYLCMYSEESINDLDSFRAQILIEDNDMPAEGFYDVYTYGTKNNEFKYTESEILNPGYHTFLIELDSSDLKFDNFTEFIEFELVSHGVDKHKFTDYAPVNMYYNDVALEEITQEYKDYVQEYKDAKTQKIFTFIGLIALSVFIAKRVKNVEAKIRDKHQFYTPEQEIQFFRDIPSDLDPNFATHLVFCKDKKDVKDDNSAEPRDGYSAAMLSLVRKKYIELERINPMLDWVKKNIKIVIKYNPAIHRTPATYSDNPNNPFENIDPNDPMALARASLQRSFDTAINEMEIFGASSSSFSGFVPTNDKPFTDLSDDNSDFTDLTDLSSSTTDSIVEEPAPFEMFEALSPTEELYFNLIVRYSTFGEIPLGVFQANILRDYEHTDSFVRAFDKTVVEIGVNEGYFQKAKYKEPRNELNAKAAIHMYLFPIFTFFFWMGSLATRVGSAYGAFLIFMIVSILCGRHINKLASKYILLTQKGEDEYQKWRGLYNFLNSETLMNERTLIELPIWEKYLIYATAFGISEKVVKALQIRCPQLAESALLNNSYYRSSSFRSSSRSFRSATRSASHTARSGGYSGGYGGGRGGGGGGGGH